MSDGQEYATGGRVGPPGGKSGVQLGDGCMWILPARQPDGSMRIESERCVLTLMPVAVEHLLDQLKNGLWPPR